LLVEVELLLSDDVELSDLLVDDSLSFLQSVVDLLNLVLDSVDLLLGVLDHLVKVLDLVVEVIDNSMLLVLLVDLSLDIVSLTHYFGLLLVNILELREQSENLLQVSLVLGVVCVHVCHV
jgi:hypothetical protein